MSDTLQSLSEFINQTDIISTHEHHQEDAFHKSLDLDKLLSTAYIAWHGLPRDKTAQERQIWLERVRYNSYFVWLEKAIQRIYGTGQITEANWAYVSSRIQETHQQQDSHIRLLREHGRYIRFLEDCFWDTGIDLGHPEIVSAVYRIDQWMTAYTPELVQEQISPNLAGKVNTLSGFEDALRDELRSRRPGIVALKNAIAYQRTISFLPVTREEILGIYGKSPELLTEQEKLKFGDYVMSLTAPLCAELDLPIQLHTGLAQLSGSSPILLEPFVARNPKTRFVFFHGGFPWVKETAGIAHNYRNVVLDINWLPLISTTSAVEALHTYIEVLFDSGHITWGGDCQTSEESIGAAMAFRHVLTKVLSEKVRDGYFDERRAMSFAEKIMYRNAQNIYNL
ncbi:amidohydrolase family protein [Paenibacillus sp. BC26]|uniref:amidohydrolase family protein n=1 Tax=Paenibacillus sp. BC26 TaxID=1881032 RepID=UPI0008E49284|nr:amidohydrolase family protein [Paenibacillus sp. BC26]SFS74238.1 Amidohydrolase [Paenibacillus sp. BC26]